MDVANETVVATVRGKPRKITTLAATAMQLATKAAGGDQASIVKFLAWIDEIEARAAAARPAQFPFAPEDIEVLNETYKRMMQCEPIAESDEDD